VIQEKAKQKARILTFWRVHGLAATLDAFSFKRRALFVWQRKLKAGGGKLEALNNGSRKPKTKRRRIWSSLAIEEIKRVRFEHPNLGKEKLYPLLVRFCEDKKLKCPKSRTIGRLIVDLGGLRIAPRRITGTGRVKPLNYHPVLRKPPDLAANYPGHVVAFDTFEEHINGIRRYVITFEDIYTRFGFAWATSSHASQAAEEFFLYCQRVFPFSFTFVLTDNGSEFKKHFSETLNRLHLTHYHTRPRTPKQNSHCERFNRTVQEEFANYHRGLLAVDIPAFNRKLADWLLWYNTERVHCAFRNKLSPYQFMLSLEPKSLPEKCKDGWPHTLWRASSIRPFSALDAFKYTVNSIPNNSFFVRIVIPTTLTGIMSYTRLFH